MMCAGDDRLAAVAREHVPLRPVHDCWRWRGRKVGGGAGLFLMTEFFTLMNFNESFIISYAIEVKV